MSLPKGTTALRLAVADLNGQARGKRLQAAAADKVQRGGARMPLSVLNVDVAGNDIAASPLVFATGDADGVLRPTDRGPLPAPWLETPTAIVPMWMVCEDGAPYAGDPRQALARVLDAYAARGWSPVVATELEFYLIDDSGPELRPPASPRSGLRRAGADIHALRALDAYDAFFTDIYAGADAMGIRADAAISEAGTGQFEVNLTHRDAMAAADDAWLFKLLTQGMARKHGCAASFMAKPYAHQPGNGFHIHASVLDAGGTNIFDDGGPGGTQTLAQAIAGCLDTMAEATLIFAPHGVSYDRFASNSHAPTRATWGYDNRTVAIRIPGGAPAARRIEHRVPGGDANPYLVLAVVLGAMLDGIDRQLTPPPATRGNGYDADGPALPTDWARATDMFETSETMPHLLPRQLIGNYVLTKRQEWAAFAQLGAEDRRRRYLDLM
ncbi:MAG: glutamine synthetase family protein [Pseudomonadota bacterium]